MLLADHSLILRLFHESEHGVDVIRYGTYLRHLVNSPDPSGRHLLKIQRVLVRSASGQVLYSRALLHGLIIPYRSYSLPFILNCLAR